ncbi:threonine synthase [Photobacterium aphoticum]|uniref:Threonine synthase n=1 Tax=Photobacterium aphoticum TaxID=754436 RepID=A0A090QUM9_9GAMM|nr:threonine synthase [Photobacterium aphoticum]
MNLYNLKDHQEQVSFGQAVRQGLGRNKGCFSLKPCPFLMTLMRC